MAKIMPELRTKNRLVGGTAGNMERLTKNSSLAEFEAMNLSLTELYTRIKAYDDTGMEPGEIKEGIMNKSLFTSNCEDWRTPKELFDELNAEFHFVLDACASPENNLCTLYFDKETNCLDKSWNCGGAVFCNPPYGRKMVRFIKKAYEENKKGVTIVLLIPARTDTNYFHDYIYKQHEVRFIRRRLRFSGSNTDAPFPSMIVVMKGREYNA